MHGKWRTNALIRIKDVVGLMIILDAVVFHNIRLISALFPGNIFPT